MHYFFNSKLPLMKTFLLQNLKKLQYHTIYYLFLYIPYIYYKHLIFHFLMSVLDFHMLLISFHIIFFREIFQFDIQQRYRSSHFIFWILYLDNIWLILIFFLYLHLVQYLIVLDIFILVVFLIIYLLSFL